jgi:2-methylcitrate dehydratase PrpD
MALPSSLTEALVDTLLTAYDGAGSAAPAEAASRLLFDHWACRTGGQALLPENWRAEPVAWQAAAGCLLDRDDVHWPSLTHPGSIIWPVVLDVGARMDVDGSVAVRAATLGYEVICRLAAALGPSHRQYWHATATAGTAGAAVAAAVLLDLDAAGIATALAHAISIAGGSSRAVLERSATKMFHRAHAVTTGIACADAAALVPATRMGLESEQGMLTAMSAAADPSVLQDPVGSWAIEETAVRLYAVTGFAHSAVDAAVALAQRRGARDIRRVLLSVSPTTRMAAGIAAPASDDEAWWSVQHAVATALVHGDPAALEAGLQRDPLVRTLIACVKFDSDREDIGATVAVVGGDGVRETASVDVPLGHPQRPASTDHLLHKWSVIAGDAGDRAWAAASRFGCERVKAVVQEAGIAPR